MTSLVIRPLTAADTDLFADYPHPPVPGVGLEGTQSYREMLAKGHYRPEWMWIALRGDEVVARLAFYGSPDAEHPHSMDWLDPGAGPDRVEVGARLVSAAYAGLQRRPEYQIFLTPGWRDRPDAAAAVADRIAACERIGLTVFVERFGYTWEPADGIPERGVRLDYRAGTDEEFVAAIVATFPGTLDAHHREQLGRLSPREVAEEELSYGRPPVVSGGRDRWRLAYTKEGELAGLVVPTDRGGGRGGMGYVAVLPAHRGRGYVAEILAEAVHIQLEHGATHVTANTDMGNRPMAAAFASAGFRVTSNRIDLR
jgi:RimJ/RimL family protein N-acetyltransferase